MHWFVIGGVFLLLSGAFFLIKTYQAVRSLPARRQFSALSTGIVWIIMGTGVLTIGLSNGEGVAAKLASALIAVGFGLYILAWIVGRATE